MRSKGEVYLYQNIHTLAGSAPLLDAHVEILNEIAEGLFELKNVLSLDPLHDEISTLLRKNNVPIGLSTYIRIELYQDGTHELTLGETSIYNGFALRCIQPKAYVLHVDLPLGDCPTSSTEHMSHIEQIRAQRLGFDIAIRCKISGEVSNANNAPLYGIINDTVYTPPKEYDTAERRLVDFIINERYKVAEQPLNSSQLHECDELFFVDHYGITAIGRVENRIYMNIIADTIAKRMQQAILNR